MPRFRLFLSLFILSVKFYSQQNSPVDSLLSLLKNNASDTNAVITMHQLALNYEFENAALSLSYAQKSLSLSNKLNYASGKSRSYTILGYLNDDIGKYKEAESNYKKAVFVDSISHLEELLAVDYNNLGLNAENSGNLDLAINYHLKAAVIRKKLNKEVALAGSYNNLGNIYGIRGIYDKALSYYFQAVNIYEKNNVKGMAGKCYNNIAIINFHENNFLKSREYYDKAIQIFIEINKKEDVATAKYNLGNVERELGNLAAAIKCCEEALSIRKEINEKGSMGEIYNALGGIYILQKDLKKAEENISAGMNINTEQENKVEICNSLVNFANLYEAKKEYSTSINYLLKAEKLALELHSLKLLGTIYKHLQKQYTSQNNFKEAYHYQSLYISNNDSLINNEKLKLLTEMNTKYETDKKEKENQLLQKDNELKINEIEQHKTTRNYLIILVLVAVAVVGGAAFAYSKIRKSNKLLGFQKKAIEQKNELLEEQKHEISEKSKEITDSIQYAQNIQLALVPSEEEFNRYFPNSFVLFKPKDIVSGDFYWAQKKNDVIYFALADCTGHGVPGAFMSMLGMSFLDELTGEKLLTDPAEILDLLRIKIISSLNKTANSNNERKDGMDIVFCAFHTASNELHFAGANNALYHIRKGIVTEHKGDKQPIGMYSGNVIQYTHQKIILQTGDAVYLTSDGYPDQFGGPKGKKFKYKQFEELLLDINQLPAKEQSTILQQRFANWKGELEQIDDVCVIGIII